MRLFAKQVVVNSAQRFKSFTFRKIILVLLIIVQFKLFIIINVKIMEAFKKLIGKKVIVRSYGAGVFIGTLNEVEPCGDKLMVELLNDRKLWHWGGACAVQQLADDGTKKPSDCKFTKFIEQEIISGVVEIIPATKEAVESIESVKSWER